MVLSVPVCKRTPHLAEKVEAAILGQMSEIADEIGDGMFVTSAAVLLENCNSLCRPGDMVSFFDPLLPSKITFRPVIISLQRINFS